MVGQDLAALNTSTNTAISDTTSVRDYTRDKPLHGYNSSIVCVSVFRIHAGSSMSGSGVSKYGCVLSSSGTNGNTRVGWREPKNFRHLENERQRGKI